MQARPFGPGQRLVRDLPDEDVTERELIGTRCPDEVVLEQVVDRRRDRRRGLR